MDDKVLERQEKLQVRNRETRSELSERHKEIREWTNQIRQKKMKYEEEKRVRLIGGDVEKGPQAAHNRRMKEVETLFDLQSGQLFKLTRCENRYLELANGKERDEMDQRWVEMIQPTEAVVASIFDQLGRISTHRVQS